MLPVLVTWAAAISGNITAINADLISMASENKTEHFFFTSAVTIIWTYI